MESRFSGAMDHTESMFKFNSANADLTSPSHLTLGQGIEWSGEREGGFRWENWAHGTRSSDARTEDPWTFNFFRKWNEPKLVFLDPSAKEFDLEYLLRGSTEVLGRGTMGTTSKKVLDDGTTLVVKMLKDVALPVGEFSKTMNALGAMRHENLLSLKAYCSSRDKKLLLFDYKPLGNLYGLLHGGGRLEITPPSWEISWGIALGAARAIEHLHSQGPDVFHGNIKSTNVLLGASAAENNGFMMWSSYEKKWLISHPLVSSYVPLVSDYGLTHIQAPSKGKSKATDPQKDDVYSFGLLLVELLTGKMPDGADLAILAEFTTRQHSTADVFDPELGDYQSIRDELLGLLRVAMACASDFPQKRPSMSEVRKMIEDLQSHPLPDQIITEEGNLSERTRNLPAGGVLEVSDRIYVFESCLTTDRSFSGQITTDWLKDDNYEFHMRGIVAKLQDQFPDASFMVINFGKQENQSHMARVLSEYDITVMELPQNYGGCPILRVEIIHNFLRSADEWLSSDKKKNMLLMHCERGGWPVLAFMLSSLLLYMKKQNGEQKTLDMIYSKAPRELLQLTSTLNPLPSQLRYLHYVSAQTANSDWPPPDKALVIKYVQLSLVPHLDAEGGWRPIVKVIGQDPCMVPDQTPKVLFSTPRSEYVRHYKQGDGEMVKLDIHCNVQGDVVLECLSLDADLKQGESIFRAMFNTTFISDSVLKLEFEALDVLWDRQGQYPMEFMAEIVFSQVDAPTSLVMVDFSSDEHKKENQIEKSMRKIEPQELTTEGRAVHSMTLSHDANTSSEDEVPELPVPSNIESTSTLPKMPRSTSESSIHSALKGSFGYFDFATKSPYTSPSIELDGQHSTAVEGNAQSLSLSNLTRSFSSSSVQSQTSLLAFPPPPPPPPPPPQSKGASSLNGIRKVPFDPLCRAPSTDIVNNSPQAPSLPPPPSPSLPSAAEVEKMMPSFELSQDAITMGNIVAHPKKQVLNQPSSLSSEMPQVVISGENTESVRGEEKAIVTKTNMEIASFNHSASSSAINNGCAEATAAVFSNSAQVLDMMLLKQEKLYQQDSSQSSISMSSGYDYDVFLSFRGPDTRSGITNFLYTRLLGARIHTFKDDEELRVGEEFGPELLKAISQSKIAIPIFSKGYASSKWCLNELVQMVECSKTRRQKIMPIFYDVTPTDVRHQTGSYEEAFLSHKEKFGANASKWRAALNHVANLNGWDISKKNRGEGELVDKIVLEIINELKMAYLLVTDCLVGVESHVKEIDTMMGDDSEDVRILGIHGMGGVGKTTLAKIIYNRLSHHFEACCFLSNIGELPS